MTQPYDMREVQPPDPVRDPFAWARFSKPRYLSFGVALVMLVLLMHQWKGGSVRQQGHRAAMGVLDTAYGIALDG